VEGCAAVGGGISVLLTPTVEVGGTGAVGVALTQPARLNSTKQLTAIERTPSPTIGTSPRNYLHEKLID
jgi:hypothetical protein